MVVSWRVISVLYSWLKPLGVEVLQHENSGLCRTVFLMLVRSSLEP